MFKRTTNDRLLADLREAALRSIYSIEKAIEKAGLEDINPHTPSVTAYSLASMFTFSHDGEPVHYNDTISRLAHMIFAGQPEREQARRDWLIWELERLGRPADAARVARLVDTQDGVRPG